MPRLPVQSLATWHRKGWSILLIIREIQIIITFREGVGEQTGAVFCTWPARAGRHDPAVWTQPKEMLVGGVWLWSQDAELEVSRVTDMEIPGWGPAGQEA